MTPVPPGAGRDTAARAGDPAAPFPPSWRRRGESRRDSRRV